MIIAPRFGFVFICMPKCASTSTEAILRPYGDIVTGKAPEYKHMPFRVYKRYFAPLLRFKTGEPASRLEVLCLFREPVDWLHSWYRYRQRDSLLNGPDAAKSTRGIGFEEFAREYVSGKPKPFAQIGRQTNMVKNKNGKLGKITLFRYEEYDLFLKYVSAKVGKKLEAPRLNESPVSEPSERPRPQFLIDHLREEYEIYESIGRAGKPAPVG